MGGRVHVHGGIGKTCVFSVWR